MESSNQRSFSQIRHCYREDNKFFLTVCEEINSLNIPKVSSVITDKVCGEMWWPDPGGTIRV